MAKRKYVELEIKTTAELHRDLDAIRKHGWLGNTMDEVVTHILRQHLFEQWTLASARALIEKKGKA